MNRLKEVRTKKGLSQTRLTMRSGIAQGTLSQIETGRLIPYNRQRQRIARALGVPVNEIFGDEPFGESLPNPTRAA